MFAGYQVCTLTAYFLGGEVGRVDAINNTQVLIVLALEFFILGHRGGIPRKLLAVCVTVLGVWLLSL